MKTIERNYRRNPHTAHFLKAFHTAGGTNLGGSAAVADDTDALALEAAEDDLLNLVPETPADLRSPAQAELMDDLTAQLGLLDHATSMQAHNYINKMTLAGRWTPGRGGNASAWISRMIAKVKELKATAAQTAPAQPAGEVEIPAHNYGIHKDGEVKCYSVDYGKEGTRWAGFLFLNRISSDDRFPVKNPAEKKAILDAIRADVEAAQILAGVTLRKCRRCGRGLSDTKNPYFAVALGPDCGAQ